MSEPYVGGVLYWDTINAKLRMACMNEDLDLIRKLSKELDINDFDCLAMRVSVYHNKHKSIKLLKELNN